MKVLLVQLLDICPSPNMGSDQSEAITMVRGTAEIIQYRQAVFSENCLETSMVKGRSKNIPPGTMTFAGNPTTLGS